MLLRLVKSAAYIHPTTVAAENVPGYLIVASTREDQSLYIGWIADSLLGPGIRKWLLEMELKLVESTSVRATGAFRDLWKSSQGRSHSFKVALTAVYSVEFRPPSSSGWWHGSLIVYPRDDHLVLPAVFLHDAQCPSTVLREKILSRNFDPFDKEVGLHWGGVDVLNCLKGAAELRRTEANPSVWLVNPTLDDLRNYNGDGVVETPQLNPDIPGGTGESLWEATKWSVLAKVADFTARTSKFVSGVLNSGGDGGAVPRSLLADRVVDDFDAARVYMAKWSLGVKQEAQRYQLTNRLDSAYITTLSHEVGFDVSRDQQFTPTEMNVATQRGFTLTALKWRSLFDLQGRLSVTVGEVKDFIFHGGVAPEIRSEVWLFLLGVYPWDSSRDERVQISETLRQSYLELKNEWVFRTPESYDTEYWEDQVFRIEKDVLRNDRDIPLYKHNTGDGQTASEDASEDQELEEAGARSHWIIKNPHLLKLRDILKTYNVYNKDLGYVQGMCDLVSPLYSVVQDEPFAFWCFAHFMDRMERNFLRDQSGICDQMITLTELVQLLLPELYEHLQACDSENLFFCFRMLLVWFKREFDFTEVCSIWEVFWTDYYSSQFQLFFALAILQKNAAPIIQNLTQFDQVIKYFNDLQGTMDWHDLMVRSELLFIRFKKMIDVMDRKQELATTTITTETSEEHRAPPNESQHLRRLLSRDIVIQREALIADGTPKSDLR
ncbi:GTPase-activating protein GYP7 KNAG_0E02880 [Huiozyma naganishii CBS 8797]|uniref:Rab-GAP TBC domain-containing protein n=1 Tax=Huiozyma naganishii (strain ATCC MYA-139 / BCRC 22969 / CBS 8797 / KCTC 17520 / NBRC 10181 / NCYC 3082 / Yp74L-3) TaxID=1071383 RepID=J7RZC1_HUIN7|nr:hypothetical protein KNAG_0E02880 [Kazachstania naganishii CBS 8797]CCK70547.1 hypothetical protein KNAG_0E02880 [Kazachstania naganishii CBS 8797]